MGNSCIEVATIAIDETMILNFKSTIALLVLLKKGALPRKNVMYVQSFCHVLSGLLINSNCCFDFLVSGPSHLFLIIMQVTTSLQNTIPWIMMKKGATKARSQFASFIFILFICLFLFHFILIYYFLLLFFFYTRLEQLLDFTKLSELF